MDVPEFKRSVRGYDSVEVDSVINDLTNRLSQMESDQAESARLVQRLNRELTEAKRNKPSFAELGSAFEETLRLAEDQSAKMVQDAINESQTLLNQARNEVKALRDKADRDARQLVSDATAKADELRLQVERDVAQERQRIADERAKIETIRSRAERAAATMVSQAEKQIADTRAEAHRNIEELKREANEVIRLANEMKVD
ncbi:MAG: hypothetical protein RLZZ40_372, partial [Actinomycetota bacterium]